MCIQKTIRKLLKTKIKHVPIYAIALGSVTFTWHGGSENANKRVCTTRIVTARRVF
jgi:hypothetical protein